MRGSSVRAVLLRPAGVAPSEPWVVPDGPQVVPGGPWVAPGGPRVVPGGPWVAPGGPRAVPGRPRVAPGEPRVAPSGFRVTLAEPRIPPRGPRPAPSPSDPTRRSGDSPVRSSARRRTILRVSWTFRPGVRQFCHDSRMACESHRPRGQYHAMIDGFGHGVIFVGITLARRNCGCTRHVLSFNIAAVSYSRE
jgi:hypothetical protein